MDKWLQQSKNKSNQLPSKPKKEKKQHIDHDRVQEERDLQLALEESRFANDIEKAIALSLCEHRQQSNAQHELSATTTTTTTAESSASHTTLTLHVQFTSSAAKRNVTVVRGRPPQGNTTNTLPLNVSTLASTLDTWAVDDFVNGLLNPSLQEPEATLSPELNGSWTSTGFEVSSLSDLEVLEDDDDATTNEDTSVKDSNEEEDKENTTTDDWELVYDPGTDVVYETSTTSSSSQQRQQLSQPQQLTSSSSPMEYDSSSPKNLNWHDEQAEDLFFGQFHRQTWDTNDIRSTHDTMKKRSMANVIKKNKIQRTSTSHIPTSSSNHDYYTTADDVLEESFGAAGFGESAAGLSWEGVGQSRYS
ncbi:unnamed protein product [Absidia cylindrospora]